MVVMDGEHTKHRAGQTSETVCAFLRFRINSRCYVERLASLVIASPSFSEEKSLTHARSSEESTSDFERHLPHCGSHRRQPIFSGSHQGLQFGGAKSAVMANCP